MSDPTNTLGPLQTEFEFTLPKGFVDDDGTLHREGTMRLATAADEIQPLQDRRVRTNSSYLTVVLLSRVVTRLGTLPAVTPAVVESLFVADIAHLQDLYERVNGWESEPESTTAETEAVCPSCGEVFTVRTDPAAAATDTVPGTDLTTGDGTTDEVGVGVAAGNAVPGRGGPWGRSTDGNVDSDANTDTAGQTRTETDADPAVDGESDPETPSWE